MRRILTTVAVIGICFYSDAAIKIREIRTASNNVIAVFLHTTLVADEQVDVTESLWKVNDKAPSNIFRYSMVADEWDHHVYLETEPLVEGSEYSITTPYGDTTFKFTSRTIFCESIKTNQAAYSAFCKSNFANFSIWLGDGGGRKISGTLPEFEVFEQYTGKLVTQGTIVEKGYSSSSGDTVYSIDLSSVPAGGPYKIALKGFGCSYPFGIGGDFSNRLAHVMFRGQYYQRCGCPIIEPYGLQIREKACHSTVYKVNGPIGEANISVTGTEPTFKCYGGYHDAGDADRRAYHIANPIVNLMIYETFPEYFYDNQFNIPDKFDSDYNIIGKENGIPDIIDEAVWGTLIWEYLQNDDGSIQWGTETRGYPSPFDAPLDKDTKKYGTVIIDDKAAAVGAGLFMHLARVIKPYDSTYSSQLAARGVKSYEYVKAKMADPEKFYYFTQKYLLDGDSMAHDQMKSLRASVEQYKPLYDCHGYSLNNIRFDNPAYFMSYILQKERVTDTSLVAACLKVLKSSADGFLQQLLNYKYPVGNHPVGTSWGHNVMQPIFACAPLLYWRMSKEQRYFDGACALMNYILGVNPLGISYVTGLGMHQVHYPHDRESAFTSGKGWGPKPGIVVFGPGVLQSATFTTYPEAKKLPVERQFGDDMSSISTAEFTIFQTMSHSSLYTILSGGGTWNEKNDPFASQQQINVRKTSVKKNSTAPVSVHIHSGVLTCKVSTPFSSRLHCALYSLNGKEITSFDLGKTQNGTHTYTKSMNENHIRRLANGVMIVRLSLDNKIIGCAPVSIH